MSTGIDIFVIFAIIILGDLMNIELELLLETIAYEIETITFLLKGEYTSHERIKEEGYLAGLQFAHSRIKSLIADIEENNKQNTIEYFDAMNFTYSKEYDGEYYLHLTDEDEDDYPDDIDESLREY